MVMCQLLWGSSYRCYPRTWYLLWGEDVPIPSGLGVEDDMDGSDDEPAEVLAAREARAE